MDTLEALVKSPFISVAEAEETRIATGPVMKS
jgi:hypothetical protein